APGGTPAAAPRSERAAAARCPGRTAPGGRRQPGHRRRGRRPRAAPRRQLGQHTGQPAGDCRPAEPRGTPARPAGRPAAGDRRGARTAGRLAPPAGRAGRRGDRCAVRRRRGRDRGRAARAVPPGVLAGVGVVRTALECTGLRYAFGAHVAVDGIDLCVQPGEIFGLLGPNGAGKTTTIRLVTTLLPAARDTVHVFGLDVAVQPLAVRRAIGYVPQLLSADGTLTGRENVSLFARLFDVPRRQRSARVNEALAAMGLTEAADRMVSTYSGGMVRRLELAQALVNQP